MNANDIKPFKKKIKVESFFLLKLTHLSLSVFHENELSN